MCVRIAGEIRFAYNVGSMLGTSPAHSASEIARYLIWRAAQEQPDDPDYLTPLKLQKLLYYVQGWHLVETGSPAFCEEIRAWREGPAVRQVYQEYRHLGKNPIVDAPAAPPELAERLYRAFVVEVRGQGIHVETGRFQAQMAVSLTNDGPVTLLIDSRKGF